MTSTVYEEKFRNRDFSQKASETLHIPARELKAQRARTPRRVRHMRLILA
jgi:hypothetical protein